MSTSDLEWLFSAASEIPSAQKLFSDRLLQKDAFDTSVEHLIDFNNKISSGEIDPQDTAQPRRNVLHFFGIGGIGKTAVLEKLFQRATGSSGSPKHWPSFKHSDCTLSCFYDLSRHNSPDPEGLLISLRQTLAQKNVPCLAFDILIARYWSENNPGESLEGYLRKRSQSSSFTENVGVSEQIEAGIGELASTFIGLTGGISGSAILKTVKLVSHLLIGRSLQKTELKSCQRFQELISAPASLEAIPFYASALSWDLARAYGKGQKQINVVVFLDHMEDIDGQMEKMLQQIVWLLPNVLFVTSGRNRLSWANPNSPVSFRRGPLNWPQLSHDAESEPRQHRIGALSTADTRHFLKDALISHQFSSSQLDALTKASGGLPYHIDLMVQHWAEMVQRDAANYDSLLLPFPDLARRVLKDLDYRERRALFASILFDRFDSVLVSKTASVDDGIAQNLLRKPLFRSLSEPPGLFFLERTLRRTFLSLAEEGHDGWSVQDWVDIAWKALNQIRKRLERADSAVRRFWLAQACQICLRFELQCSWLSNAALLTISGSDWDPNWKITRLKGTKQSDQNKELEDFCRGLSIIFQRQANSRDSVAQKLQEIYSVHYVDPRFDLLRYYAAQAFRDAGLLPQADELFQRLIESKSELMAKALHGKVHLLRRKGQIKEALEIIDNNHELLPTPFRLRGEIHWTQARFEQAAELFSEARRDALAQGKLGEAWLATIYYCFSLSWTSPGPARDTLNHYLEDKPEFPSSWADGFESITKLLITEDGDDDLFATWQSNRACAVATNQTTLICYHDLAAVFCFHIRDNRELTETAFESLSSSAKEASTPYIIEIASFIVGRDVDISGASWADDRVRTRWEMVTSKRAQDLANSH